jgi:hypothetical protein
MSLNQTSVAYKFGRQVADTVYALAVALVAGWMLGANQPETFLMYLGVLIHTRLRP